MPNVKKLIEKMKQQPNGIRSEEVEKVCGNQRLYEIAIHKTGAGNERRKRSLFLWQDFRA